ncbi:MAG: rRNA maturation RNase YbeY [bacterium]|nr:rRNA maturation RNase YbeY [bacterium]
MKVRLPSILWKSDFHTRIAKDILPGWEISLAFVTPKIARSLNKNLRGKSYTPNVLSYVVGKKHGEVLICKEVARKEARDFGLSYSDFLILLFVHALLHLKGGRHGTTMEKREQALLRKYGSVARIYGPSHRNRNRHRHLPSEDRRRRRITRQA